MVWGWLALIPYGGRIVEFDPDGVEKKIGVRLPRCDLYKVEDPTGFPRFFPLRSIASSPPSLGDATRP